MLTSSYPTRPGDWRGGFVRDLARALIARDVDVEVAAPRPRPDTGDEDDGDDDPAEPGGHDPRVAWLPSLLPADGRAFHGAGIEANLRADPLGAATLPPFLLAFAAEAAIRSVFADVIVAHWLLPMGAVGSFLARLGRKPLVVVAHSGPAGVLAVPPFRNAVRYVVRAATAVACVSDAVLDRVAAVAGTGLAGR
ncbi:MAG: glycosyltransferase, partial [Deltaproteobacteria bacterium]|nr:glycosyltransferase [Deltaproteobacteria bacterium]